MTRLPKALAGHVRALCLAGSGLTFGAIAVLAVVAPRAVANAYGLGVDRIEGMNELRAVFTGFWLSLAVAMLTAARRRDLPLLGDLCAIMILLQALGRALSFALDGWPHWTFVAAFAGEMLTAITILVLRSPPLAESARP